MTEQPRGDRVGAIEINGINPIPDAERHGSPFELFWVWFAANVAVLGIVYGVIIAGMGLNLWQSALTALVGCVASFSLVGVLSIAGKWSGAPALTLSRAAFGPRGNLGPTLISWISLVGWETALVVTATYALLGLLNLAGIPSTRPWTVACLVVISCSVVALGLLGHATLVWIQRTATYVFGVITLFIVVFLVGKTNWHAVFSAPPGPWDSGVLAALTIVAAGTGLGWVNSGADYARYLPRSSSSRAIVGWTVLGASLPLFILIMVGVLLTSATTGLGSAANPISAIGAVLPSWMAVPYLLTAIGGLIAGADLDIYSSGLNLLALGLPVRRYQAVFVDGVLMIAGSIYILLIAKNFLGTFETFLSLLADALTAWSAVFLVDMVVRRRVGYDPAGLINTGSSSRYYGRGGANPAALIAWLAGLVVGLLFTSTTLVSGPLAQGVFAASNIGYFLGFIVSVVLYATLGRWGASERAAPVVVSGARP